ncbi:MULTISPECIES: hypothetical protein [unclassified Streptomyces]|uniref:hypothetical protein n=1 Tax=unclassified Streptomyces TaxID=2593676 RepID=UPI00081E4816|nr:MULTISPECIES: hypothetical protein [unclassified Streptomyces]MYR30565.1 hypothetical protein [Streptomyces sp. SID4945]SCF50142.1 hypothetical protein GA0115257_12414 [Streptomyces sp. LcepLS]
MSASDAAREWMYRADHATVHPAHARRKVAGRDIDAIRAAHADGATVQALAAHYQVSARTIRAYL